ncbi:DsbA family oxidoreductase [Arthrobacter sp. Sa2BUA2]|uniref:DsbA family oxidoreductase n=1 Tax=Arthrobacter pullicola TaxID=2762224 RepID=A0ABR8YKX7_9MICC|nr:DsbA family oxidoreductase [Arthrobacter pullicola]MBD8044887.1 DsbA family oxidoreductase [Arthrobacter pullicola]
MLVEIWSDIGCPWCFIGKRRFETALSRFEHASEVEVRWRSYQLDPSVPEHFDGTEVDYLSRVKGMDPAQVAGMLEHVTSQAAGEGLNYRFEDLVVANSFTAHRLIHLARESGGEETAAAVKEALLSAHFEKGLDIASHDVLAEIGSQSGLDPETVRSTLAGTDYAEAVEQDVAEARALGVNGVPFFVLDRRYGISGAQPAELFEQALAQAWEAGHQPLQPAAATAGASPDGASCSAEGCS